MRLAKSVLLCALLLGLPLVAQAGSNNLTWDAYIQGSDPAVSFTLRHLVSTTCTDLTQFAVLATGIPVTATTYQDANLPGNLSYCYSLRAVDAHGVESDPSNTAVATMPQVAGPVNLSGSVSGTAISLFWGYAPATANPAIGTQVVRSINGAPPVQLATLTPTTVMYTDFGSAGNQYTYSLQSIDSGGGVSVPTATLTFQVSAPAPLHNLRTTIGP